MVSKIKIKKVAEIVVKCINLKIGENVLIRGNNYFQNIIEEIALEIAKNGGIPYFSTQSDNYLKRYYESVPIEYIRKTPQHLLGMTEKTDIIINMDFFKDPITATKIPRDKIEAHTEANQPIRDIIYEKGKKWLYLGWPTPEAAKYFKISLRKLEDIIINGILIDYNKLNEKCMKIANAFKETVKIHAIDNKGTNLYLKINGRRINLDDGIISDEDISIGEVGANLPAGEVFIAPIEEYGEGALFCPLTRDRFTGKIIKDALLVFKNGKIVLEESNAKKNFDHLKDTVEKCMKIDEKRYSKIGANNICELGIGLNPHIKKAIGYILTDEKIEGSIHVAIGENRGYGGNIASSLHWDFVTSPKITLEIEKKNGEKITIMENGKILI
ncbi:MAG: aminopeptidase [Nitrososphaerota archaeon]